MGDAQRDWRSRPRNLWPKKRELPLVGRVMRQARFDAGMTCGELSGFVDCDEKHIILWENRGEIPRDGKVLMRLCEALTIGRHDRARRLRHLLLWAQGLLDAHDMELLGTRIEV